MGGRRPPSLRRQRDISYLFRTGKRLRLRYCTIILAPAPDGQSKLLVAAGRKIGKSVKRSRARRRLRELGWLLLGILPEGWWLGLIGKPGIDRAPWQELVREASEAIAGAGLARSKA